MTGRLLSVAAVVKRFGAVVAVDDLSFEVGRGEIFALLGPNGAGKTTTLRMLLGLLRPDEGEIQWQVDGSAGRPAAAAIGYLPEERGLFREAPVGRTIAYFGILRGMERAGAHAAARAWLDRLGLTERAGERPDALSKGNQQKIQLAAALVHRPLVAILDEPFSGLDPVNQELFLELLREERARGATVLLSAHQMQLVERVADRILVVDRGREALSGTLEQLRRGRSATTRLHLTVRTPADAGRLDGLRGVAAARLGAEGELEIEVVEGGALGEVLAAVASSFDVLDVRSERATLHEIYLAAVGRGDRPGVEP